MEFHGFGGFRKHLFRSTFPTSEQKPFKNKGFFAPPTNYDFDGPHIFRFFTKYEILGSKPYPGQHQPRWAAKKKHGPKYMDAKHGFSRKCRTAPDPGTDGEITPLIYPTTYIKLCPSPLPQPSQIPCLFDVSQCSFSIHLFRNSFILEEF